MYRKYTRTMNDRERAKLREFSEVPDGLTAADLSWRFVGLAAGVVVILSPVWMQQGSPAFYPPLVLAGLALFGMSVYKYFRDRQTLADLTEREERVLADGRVEVERFECLRAIELETGGEGTMFIVELTDGRVAFLSGTFLAHTADELPSTEFELVMTRVDDVWLGIFSSGEPLDPPIVRAPSGFPPNDFDEVVFVEGNLDEDLKELCQRAVDKGTSEP
jgi:hypothetical protein